MQSAESQTPVARTEPSLRRRTAFTHDERRKLGLAGWRPATVQTLRVLEQPAQISDADKLARIRAVISHPGIFHWAGQDVATVIRRILEGDL